jgi:glycosyltransferase involved in cell wall biosynthesis
MARIFYYAYHYISRGRGIIKASDAVIAISDELYTLIPKEYGISQDKVHLVYNGIDIGLFRPKSVVKKPHKSILFVGQLVEQKGAQHLIRAMPTIREKFDARLTVVGGGPYLDKLEELTLELELGKRTTYKSIDTEKTPWNLDEAINDNGAVTGPYVEFVGSVPHDKLPEYYSACDVCVFPTTRKEGMPLAVMEAMACEAPVIASDIGGIKSIITSGLTGILIPPGDVKSIAASVIEVLNEPILAREMAKNARKRCIEHFSLDEMVTNTLRVYMEVTNV